MPVQRILVVVCFLSLNATCLADQRVDFRTDVIPVLTKLGCNSGACHGSAAGRGEFHLSLYGSRPSDDYDSIVREFHGRRINLADISRSLILRKPGGELDHEGGFLIEESDESRKILTDWLNQGATLSLSSSPQVLTLETSSASLTFDNAGTQHPLKFTARFDDGRVRDVTQWTVVTTSDDSAVHVDPETNMVNIHRAGRHVLVARYLNHVIPVELIVPFTRTTQPIEWSKSRNFVDDEVNARLNQLRLPATPLAADAEFLRRLTLHLTGSLPIPEQVIRFREDSSDEKRERLIDKMLRSDGFVDYWTFRLAEQLRIRTQPADRIGAQTYHTWLKEQVDQGTGWDKIARRLLTASGDSHFIGEANFFRTGQGARGQTEFVSEALMGVTLRCANCHDHPFDRWTQDDYHGLAAIFSKTKQGRIIEPNPLGMNTNPLTGQPALAKLPGEPPFSKLDDGRSVFADWLTTESNPYFAKAMVNRIWKALMGRGLVEPVDDLRMSNPASHPELLNRLAEDFAEHGYRIRHTIGVICRSDAYQRTRAKHTNVQQQIFYGARSVQRLPAEVLADAICAVTGVPEDYSGEPAGTKAIQLFDSRTPSAALDVLGRCSREESCEAPSPSGGVGLSSQLHLINGRLINEKLVSKYGRLTKQINRGDKVSDIVNKYYLLCFSRPASGEELAFWRKRISGGHDVVIQKSHRESLEDFVWSLLNSREFYCSH